MAQDSKRIRQPRVLTLHRVDEPTVDEGVEAQQVERDLTAVIDVQRTAELRNDAARLVQKAFANLQVLLKPRLFGTSDRLVDQQEEGVLWAGSIDSGALVLLNCGFCRHWIFPGSVYAHTHRLHRVRF